MPLCTWGQQPEYVRFFDPANGFKPAQINLTDIFLQLAGSLECYGSPEPYMRHIQAENERIAKEYSAKTGKESKSHLPAYMTDAYIDQAISNWKIMTPKLHLENLAKDAGLCAREAIRGKQDGGTVLVEIFNHHQDLVAKGMEGGSPKAGFEQLKATLTTELEFDKPQASPEQALAAAVECEKALSEAERKEYAALLKHDRFTKAEFSDLDHFYRHGHDKLTDAGKKQMTQRVWKGTHPGEFEDTRLEAIKYTQTFCGEKSKLYKSLDAALPLAKASKIEAAITDIFLDLGQMVQSELEIGILEAAIR